MGLARCRHNLLLFQNTAVEERRCATDQVRLAASNAEMLYDVDDGFHEALPASPIVPRYLAGAQLLDGLAGCPATMQTEQSSTLRDALHADHQRKLLAVNYGGSKVFFILFCWPP